MPVSVTSNILLKDLHPAQHLFAPIQITGVDFTPQKESALLLGLI